MSLTQRYCGKLLMYVELRAILFKAASSDGYRLNQIKTNWLKANYGTLLEASFQFIGLEKFPIEVLAEYVEYLNISRNTIAN